MNKIRRITELFKDIPRWEEDEFEERTLNLWEELKTFIPDMNDVSGDIETALSDVLSKHTDVSNMFKTFQDNADSKGGYSQNTIDLKDSNIINAKFPFSGFVSEPKFIFKEEQGFEYKAGIDCDFVNIAGKLFSLNDENVSTIDFTGTLPNVTVVSDNSKVNGSKGDYFIDSSDTLKQATKDFADMFSNKDSDGTVYINGSVIIKCTGTNTNGVIGGFYRRVDGYSGNLNLATTSLQSTVAYEFLGTADAMSLDNPYFRNEIAVTNQVLAYYEVDSNNILSIKTEILIERSFENETPIEVLNKNGISYFKNGLFKRNGLSIIPIGFWQTKNEGAYHLSQNGFGVMAKQRSDGLYGYWHDSLQDDNNSLSGNFKSDVQFITGSRSDNKVLHTVYENDFIPLFNTSNETNNTELKDRFFTNSVSNNLKGINAATALMNIEPLGNSPIWSSAGSTITVGSDIQIYSKESTLPYQTKINADEHRFGSVVSVIMSDGEYFCFRVNSKQGGNQSLRGEVLLVSVDINNSFSWSGQYANPIGTANIQTKLPILSRGSQLKTNVVGSPISYPADWKNILAKGKTLMINPLIIGQDGTNYLTNPILSGMILSNKTTNLSIDVLYSADGIEWTNVLQRGVNNISNKVNSGLNTSGNIFVLSYTSVNDFVLESKFKRILALESKVVASNSHHSNIVNACLGKVAVSNSSNRLENKILENANITAKYDKRVTSNSPQLSWTPNQRILFDKSFDNYEHGVYETLDTNSMNLSAGVAFYPNSFRLVELLTTPKHTKFDIDSSPSPTCKYFTAIAEEGGYKYGMVYAKELIHNGTDFGDDNTFEQLSNGTITDLNDKEVITFVGSYRLPYLAKEV